MGLCQYMGVNCVEVAILGCKHPANPLHLCSHSKFNSNSRIIHIAQPFRLSVLSLFYCMVHCSFSIVHLLSRWNYLQHVIDSIVANYFELYTAWILYELFFYLIAEKPPCVALPLPAKGPFGSADSIFFVLRRWWWDKPARALRL